MKKVLMVLSLILVVLGTMSFGVAAERMQVVFEDDFLEGAAKWEILEDEFGTIAPGPNNDYLKFGHYGVNVHMRIPGIITNSFDLVIDVDLNTGSPDWFGIRFGTVLAASGTGPGHLLWFRPSGQIQLWRQPVGSWKHGTADEIFELGWVDPFTAATEILLRVRPDYIEVEVQGETLVFDDIVVDPGYVDFYAMNPGPVKLYYVELAVPVD